MKISKVLSTVAILLGLMICQASAETWISTWAAPAYARVDQPAQTLSAAAQAFP